MTTPFDRFHSDLGAAIAAGAPIQLSQSPVRLTQKQLDQAKEKMASHLAKSNSDSLTEVIESVDDVLPRYRAALKTFAQTKTMLPVLEGLTTQLIAEKKVGKALRHTFYYLFVLVGVTVLGMLFYSYKVMPEMLEIRKDVVATFNHPASESFDPLPWIPLFTTILAIVLGAMLIWFLWGGIKKLAMWCGGADYVRKKNSYIALRITQLLIESGMKPAESIELGCVLSNCDSKAQANVASAFNIESDVQDTIAIRRLGDYLIASAHERLNYIRTVVPITLITIVGGTITLIYCLIVYWPFVDLLWDVSHSMGGTR